MKISLVAAYSHQRVMGFQNKLPWHLPADLKHFKQLTLHKKILMGRQTYESIGHPLPNRINLILTRQPDFKAPGCQIIHHPDDIPKNEEIMVIGGAKIFDFFLAKAQTLYLTEIDADLSGDTFFPLWDKTQWTEILREFHTKDEKNPYNYTFLHLCRKT